MKIYVASKWEEKDRVREVMRRLELVGHSITHNWTLSTNDFNANGAVNDIRGVQDADVFVGIFQKDLVYKGALVEMGAALALGKPVYIIGNAPSIAECIFIKHPNVKDEAAYVRELVNPQLAEQPSASQTRYEEKAV